MHKMWKDGNRKYILIAATLVFVLAVYLAFNLMYKSKGYKISKQLRS
jgi:hypothetical protein